MSAPEEDVIRDRYLKGAPDVEQYNDKIWEPGDPDTELHQTATLYAGTDEPQDYIDSGELRSISSLASAFPPDPDTNSTLDSLNKFLFEIYSGREPDARESWANFLDAADAFGASRSEVKEAFFNHIAIILGMPHDPDGDGTLGNLEDLYQALGGSAQLGSRSAFRELLIENALDYFFINYDFTIPEAARDPDDVFGWGGLDPDFDYFNNTRWQFIDSDDNVEDSFFESFVHFFSARSITADDPYFIGDLRFSGGGPVVDQVTTDYLASYEKIFTEFVVQPPFKPYDEVLAEFYNEVVARDGFFLPSQHLKDWLITVQEQQRIQGGTATSVEGTNSQKTAILLAIFRLLVEVIEVLQDVARAQGTRLQFYAGYQRAYTDLLKNIPVISKENVIDLLKASKTSKIQEVMSFTQSQNQSFTEKVRSFRSIVGDEAKQHQTTVNQSNEIVTQQANLGTSILQQLSTILTNLFK